MSSLLEYVLEALDEDVNILFLQFRIFQWTFSVLHTMYVSVYTHLFIEGEGSFEAGVGLVAQIGSNLVNKAGNILYLLHLLPL